MFEFLRKLEQTNKTDELREIIEPAVEEAVLRAISFVREDFENLEKVAVLKRQKLGLEEDLEKLKLQKERKEEEFDRREREIEHKVGLDRQRMEQEGTLQKREAVLEAKESNLEQSQEAFDERMEFFKQELSDQKGLLKSVLDRLPTAEIFAGLGTPKSAE